jgi:hypothetical protein
MSTNHRPGKGIEQPLKSTKHGLANGPLDVMDGHIHICLSPRQDPLLANTNPLKRYPHAPIACFLHHPVLS